MLLRKKLIFPYLLITSLLTVGACKNNKNGVSQNSVDSQTEFVAWAKENRITLNSMTPSEDNSDLEAIFQEAGNYQVIALSEGFHNCSEMLQLHHRMIRYLVEEHGFNTVVTESGLPESRLAYDFIKNRPNAKIPWKKGINKMYSEWNEGLALIQWMKEYNASHDNVLAYYGIDIGGFYQDWKTPLTDILKYLESVDGKLAKSYEKQLEPWLDILSENARVNYINVLSPEEQNQIGLILKAMSTDFQENKENFVAKSGELEYQWAKQSTLAMGMADNYYQNYIGQRNGTREYVGLNGREIAMADNIKWVLEHRKDAKIILIDHVVHTKTETQHQEGIYGFFTPAGAILKQELKDKLFVVGMTYGGGKFWNDWHNLESRFIDTIPQSSPNGIEKTMGKVASEPYYIYWKDSSNRAKSWMNSIHEMRENNYSILIQPNEWDGCVYLPTVSPGSPFQ